MPVRVDEPITVTLSPEGEPRSFVWRRFEYEIIGVPLSFFRRRQWWREKAAESLTQIDDELWRVEASSTGLTVDAKTYDIARQSGPEGWRLALAWE